MSVTIDLNNMSLILFVSSILASLASFVLLITSLGLLTSIMKDFNSHKRCNNEQE